MKKIKEVMFFSIGDSSDASTWSNVPYLFTKHLEKKGILVRRINLKSPSLFNQLTEKIWNRLIYKILNLFFKRIHYYYSRCFLSTRSSYSIIKKSLKKYPQVDFCIFIGYDYINKFNNIPSLLFGDWTLEVLIKERENRNPFYIEKKLIEMENDNINSAAIVVSLFAQCKESMKRANPKANIIAFDKNVINNLYDGAIQAKEILEKKEQSKCILFVGRGNYLKGAQLLVETFHELYQEDNSLQLHIIGLTKKQFEGLPNDNVYFHGFLRKDVKEERDLYYELLINAKVVVNPTPIWGGYSSIIESMFFYTPVILSPFKEFVSEFGSEISFGIYNHHFEKETLLRNIEKIMYMPHSDYQQMSISAHKSVESYTWDNYVDNIIRCMENNGESY